MTAAKKETEVGTVGVLAEPKSDPALAVPTVGRVVHFFKGEVPLAATVAEVGLYEDPHKVTLMVIERRGPRMMHEVEFAAEPTPGKWSWPARA